jgi:hypothetical protein
MIKIIFPLLFIFGLSSCHTETETSAYFGQTPPDTLPVIFAPGKISIANRLEHGISFTPDAKELAFGLLNKSDFSGKIYYSSIRLGNWIEPMPMEALIGKSAFLPYFSPDGKTLLYTQSRPDTSNYLTDIWLLTKKGDHWRQTEKLKSPINSLSRESTACQTSDKTIYFSSNRDANGLADLFCSSLNKGIEEKVRRIDAISTDRDEESIYVSSDESYIIFCRYATNENGPDLFISYRDYKGTWLPPTQLDSTINSADWERRPFVSFDNKYLFFTKIIFNQSGLSESDIYWVSTQKVFKPYVFNPIAKQSIKIGQKTEVNIPEDYFNDIDNEQIEINLNQQSLDWVILDKEKMILIMHPRQVGEFDLILTAVDTYANATNDTLKIIVEE